MVFSAIAKPGTGSTAGLASSLAAIPQRDPEYLRKLMAGEVRESDSYRGGGAPVVNKSVTTAPPARAAATAANQADFLGEGTSSGPARPDNGATASAPTAAGRAANQAAANMNAGRIFDPRSVNYAPGGPWSGAKPNNYGLSLDPSTAREAAADQQGAIDARKARDGGFGGDLARLGTYAISSGPIYDAIGAYTPQAVADTISIPRSIVDEAADQIIPGGSGAYGRDIVPLVGGTGGDKRYPSSTIQSGPNYEGVTNSGNTGIISGAIDGVDGYAFGDKVKSALGIGGPVAPKADLNALAADGQRRFDTVAASRAAAANDMYARGSAAQGRAAPQSGYVDYGGPQNIARTPDAAAGNFGAEQRISAPTLAAARDAAMGNFGGQQSVSAARVGPAAQAANAAGFLSGTADQARSISDLDMSLSNESRGAMGESINRIRSYVDQGPGESVAQAQLRQAQEQSLGDALSLARSGRGNAAGNMKMALSENAATNAQTNQSSALLRAAEADAWRGRQLQGLGLEQSGTQAMRTQDITAAQAAGQHALGREQIASNVDVSRAGLEQQLGIANAEQTNIGNRLQAQLSTDANISQASLANARNIAQGQAGTQVNLQNAEQSNLNNRLGAQMQLDAATQQAALANARNIASGQAGTQVGIANADNAAARARAQAELANQLAIAQGNSRTDITGRNLDAQVQTAANNDDLMGQLYGYGVDLGRQEFDATNAGVGTQYDYASLANEIARAEADRKSKREAAVIGGIGSVLGSIL